MQTRAKIKNSKGIAFPIAAISSLLLGPLAALAAGNFDEATKNYLDGNYDKALGQFQELAKASPNDARLHYYMGLCYMRNHDRDKAGDEFELMESQTKDPSMKLVAQQWLFRMERHRKNISDNYSVARPDIAKEHGPVTKVFWFYTNWCPKCRMFRASFEQAQKNFKGIKFENYNAEDPKNWALVSKYKVKAYPTLVYFDKDGKVIENYAAAPMGNTFTHHLQELGGKFN